VTTIDRADALHGQGLVEYSLILLLIAAAAFAALQALGPAVSSLFEAARAVFP